MWLHALPLFHRTMPVIMAKKLQYVSVSSVQHFRFQGDLAFCTQPVHMYCERIDQHSEQGMPANSDVMHRCSKYIRLTSGAGRRGQLWHGVCVALAAPQALIATGLHVQRRRALHANMRARAE